MYETAAHPLNGTSVQSALREQLAQGDAAIGTIAPILRHLLANDEHSLLSEEIVARVRGMIGSLARQLLDEWALAVGASDSFDYVTADLDQLTADLGAHPGTLAHAHALAVEWQLSERLLSTVALDPVLSPLLQALVSSPDPTTAASAMALLAAQARFVQTQRRMELPITELPGELIHAALRTLTEHFAAGRAKAGAAAQVEAAIRVKYDESRTRLGLLSRLVSNMGGGATAALLIPHAGAAIFLTALALGSGQERDLAVLATSAGQRSRLALALRAAGLRPHQIAAQVGTLHPDAALPEGIALVSAEQAAALLARSSAYRGM